MKTSGLDIEHLRKTLSSLVDKGSVCICKTLQGNYSYRVSNIEDSEAIIELKDQSDGPDSKNDPVNLEFPTQRADLQPYGHNKILKTDFLVFLDVVRKLTDDITSLQVKVDMFGLKKERLL